MSFSSDESAGVDGPDVELIEGATAVHEAGDEVRSNPGGAQLAMGFASLVAILLALFAMSRPTDSPRLDEVEQARLDRGDRPETDSSINPLTDERPDTDGSDPDAVDGSENRTLPSIRPFDGNLPNDLPGVISSIDDRGSIVVVAATETAPVEHKLGLEPLLGAASETHLGLLGSPMIGLSDADFSLDQSRLEFVQADGRPGGSFDLLTIVPDQEGGALLVEASRGFQVVTYHPFAPDAAPLQWQIEGEGAEVVGIWQGQLVLHQANRTWLLDVSSDVTPVADGQLLGFDGRLLARLVCSGPSQCEIAVGPPNLPDARVVPVPEAIRTFATDTWTESIAVSPDGNWMAASVRFEVLSFPVVIDLNTGGGQVLVDGMNQNSPVAWSPDSQWLGYLFNDDVMVWSLADQRSWLVRVGRNLQTLLWR